MVWYSNLLNFPEFAVIHTIKGSDIVNKVEVDVFLELSCFFDDPEDVGNLISGSSAFSKTSLNIWEVQGSCIAEAAAAAMWRHGQEELPHARGQDA